MSLANISRKITDMAMAAPKNSEAPTVPEGISLSMVRVSERLTALEEAVKEIQARLAGPTSTKGPLNFSDILPSGGGKRRRRRTRKNRS